MRADNPFVILFSYNSNNKGMLGKVQIGHFVGTSSQIQIARTEGNKEFYSKMIHKSVKSKT
jgi:hypothetical protein